MGVGIAFTDDKKVCGGVTEFAKIKLNDIFAFFVADTFHDGMIEVLELRIFCPPCWCGCQNAVIQLSMR